MTILAHKKLNLFLISILCILLFFTLPVYRTWLTVKILASNVSVYSQMFYTDIEFRKEYRYESTYKICKNISDYLNKQKAISPVILIPPKQYLKERGITNFEILEPAIYYYYSGLNVVWATSPNVESANWAIEFKKSKFELREIKNKAHLHQLLDTFKLYTP